MAFVLIDVFNFSISTQCLQCLILNRIHCMKVWAGRDSLFWNQGIFVTGLVVSMCVWLPMCRSVSVLFIQPFTFYKHALILVAVSYRMIMREKASRLEIFGIQERYWIRYLFLSPKVSNHQVRSLIDLNPIIWFNLHRTAYVLWVSYPSPKPWTDDFELPSGQSIPENSIYLKPTWGHASVAPSIGWVPRLSILHSASAPLIRLFLRTLLLIRRNRCSNTKSLRASTLNGLVSKPRRPHWCYMPNLWPITRRHADASN